MLFQIGVFWIQKSRFEDILSSKGSPNGFYIINGVCTKLFVISSLSTIEDGDVGKAYAQRKFPIWDVKNNLFNIGTEPTACLDSLEDTLEI